jgi:tetratricopeptide (TPR) repeat protein
MFDKNNEITQRREAYYYLLGLYDLKTNNLDSAEYYFRKLIRFNQYKRAYNGLMQLYYKKKDADSVFKYSELYSKNIEKSAYERQTDLICQMKSLYDYSHYKNDALALQIRNQRNIILFCFIGGAMIIVIVVGCLYFRKRVKQKKREIELISKKFQISEKKCEKINSEYNNLRSEYKKKEETLETKTKELSESLKKHMYVNAESKVLNSELGQIIRFRPRFLSNDEWILLDKLTKDNMTCFYELISNIQLSVQERQVCMLSRLGCTSQNIMIILNLSYSAGVSNVKRSVNKKMFNDNNARTLCDNMLAKEKEIIKKQELLIDN